MGPPYRVLHLVRSLHTGGIGRSICETVAALDRNVFSPIVGYFAPPHDLARQIEENNVPLYHLGHSGSWGAPRSLQRLRHLIRVEEVDLVHTHLDIDRAYGALAARLEGRPVVTTLHWSGQSRKTRDSIRSRARRAAMNAAARLWTDRLVAVSEAVRSHHTDVLGIPADRIAVIHTGVDTAAIRRAAEAGPRPDLRHELGISDTQRVVLNVARLMRSKGHRHLISMLPTMPEDVVLVIAGEGGARHELEEMVEREGVGSRVRLLGKRSDVYELLGLAEIFAFPSTAEGFSVAVLEALAAGVPVVAFRIPALEEVVCDGRTGLLVEDSNVYAFGNAVARILGDADLARILSEGAARDAADRFDRSVAVRALEGVYREVLSEAVR